MADKTYDDLDPANPLTGPEKLMVTQNGNSVYTTVSELAQAVADIMPEVIKAIKFRGVRAHMVAAPSATGAMSVIIAHWDATIFDTDQFWSLGAPNRLVIPEGIKRVQLFASTKSVPEAVKTRIIKNSSIDESIFDSNTFKQTFTGIIDVVPGDYFEVEIERSTSTNGSYTPDPNEDYFILEVKETDL